MLTLYPTLLEQSPDEILYAQEKIKGYTFLNERHLQAMWLEQKYFKNLKTSEGQEIKVLSPGIWNQEAGPDFLKAHLLIDNMEYKGDIELHLSPESWFYHKHHLDPRYNNVVLHISYWEPKEIRPLYTAAGRELIQSFFEPSLTIPESRLFKLIDLDLYPYKKFVGSGKCAETLLKKLKPSESAQLLRSAALWRLKQKRSFLQNIHNDKNKALSCGIAMALGYKHNALPFLDIYKRLNDLPKKGEDHTLADALGLCGFFEERYRDKWFYSTYYQKLASLFDKTNNTKEARINLRLDKIRPANHPIRRLAVMSKLLYDPNIESLLQKSLELWESHWKRSEHNAKAFSKLRQKFSELLPTYPDPYWATHYTFEETECDRAPSLIGNDLKQEIIVNVIFPLLIEEISVRQQDGYLETFLDFFSSFSPSSSRKAEYLQFRFFGEDPTKYLLKSTEHQQGAFQIHKDFCTRYEASCVGCPFVENYNKATHQNLYSKQI